MKTFILTIIIASFLVDPVWLTDFEQAQNEARQSHKLILLNFAGSDWCAPCIKMKRDVYEQEAFRNYVGDNLVLVRADFPRLKKNQLEPKQKAHNEKLAELYNPTGKFPLTLLLNEDGKVIKSWEGYSGESPQEFVNEIQSFRRGK